MSTPKPQLRQVAQLKSSDVTKPLQETLVRYLNPKRWFYYMAETVILPRYLVVVVLGAILPAIFGLLLALGAFLWSVSNQITRIDERQLADRALQVDKNKTVERQGALNDEHLRQLQQDQARFEGWQKGRAGEGYQPRRDERTDQPTQ